jgi:hypothetical protein
MSTTPKLRPLEKLPWMGRLALIGAVPLGVAIAIYGPALSMVMWHATHWGPVRYRGLAVKVPWGWTADTQNLIDDPPANPQGLMISRLPLSLRFKGQDYEGIDVNVLLARDASSDRQARQSWEEIFRSSHLSNAFIVTTPQSPLPHGTDCLVAKPVQEPGRVEWSCISASNGWMASFAGQPADVPTFLGVLRGLKPAG